MRYRENCKNGDRISQLGFGCMRLGRDDKEIERQIAYAIEHGVNYFDTAYIYPGNEAALGRVLSRGYRRRVFVATKLPGYLVRSAKDFDRILQTELKRLQTDYIDYYFMHMLTHYDDWQRLCALGVEQWLERQRAAGVIRNSGFSYHGGREQFVRLIDGRDWDFCMLQYNYFDEHNQAGRSGLQYAAQKGIPVMVMEPLRGGRLAQRLPPPAQRLLQEHGAGQSAAAWGLRWVWHHAEVLTVLSGMNSMAMVEENIRVADEAQAGALTPPQLAVYAEMREMIQAHTKVPCTGCNYCMPCPQGVDIPLCFATYNDTAWQKWFLSEFYYIVRVGEHHAARCNGCGRCEQHCPQGIAIREQLRQLRRALQGFYYKPLRFAVDAFMRRKG